jgi:hypothetical protein
MAKELILAIGGMAVLAVGVWLIESRAQRKAVAWLLCACGIVLVAIPVGRASLNWRLHIAVFGAYLGTGGLLGSTLGNISVKHGAGAILANLGMAATTGLKIMWAIAAPAGILSVVMQPIEPRRPGSVLMLVGQGLLFATFGLQAMLMARVRWSLADRGIAGPNAFVPWPQVSAWYWESSDMLAIALKPEFRRGRTLRIPVQPEVHERVTAILASKVPA